MANNRTTPANIKEYDATVAADNLREELKELEAKLKSSIEASAYFADFLKRIITSDYDSPLHLLDAACMYATSNKMFVECCYAFLIKHNIPTGHMADFLGCIANDNSKCRIENSELRFLNYVAHTAQYEQYRDMFVPIFSIYAVHNPTIEIVCEFISKNELIDISALFSDFRD